MADNAQNNRVKLETCLNVLQYLAKQQKHAFPDNTNTPVGASNYLGWLYYGKDS